MKPEQLLTVDEVAKYLRCHPQTVRRAIHAGKMDAYKMQGQYRITQPAVQAFLEKQDDDHGPTGEE